MAAPAQVLSRRVKFRFRFQNAQLVLWSSSFGMLFCSLFSWPLLAPVLAWVPGFSILESVLHQFLISTLKTGPIPQHVSFVMDGNRRFAQTHRLPLKEGHRLGAEAMVKVLDCCYLLGIKSVTTYAFSIENFSRKPEEIDTIFSLLKAKLALISHENQICDLHQIRVKIIGNKSYLPPDVLKDIELIEKKTANHTKHNLFIALPYTSRDDIAHSISIISEKISANALALADINSDLIEHNFYYDGLAEPVDILVRTSGHTRLSDYMLWQCHQDSVIEYPNTLWPDYKFLQTWWTIFKWSYCKTLIIEDAEKMQIKRITSEQVNRRYQDVIQIHPPFASVTKN